MPRNASTHAAGVVITRRPGVRLCAPGPERRDASVTQYTMTTLEELGLLKMDFLGLRNLTVILDDAEKMVQQPEAGLLDLHNIPGQRPGDLCT